MILGVFRRFQGIRHFKSELRILKSLKEFQGNIKRFQDDFSRISIGLRWSVDRLSIVFNEVPVGLPKVSGVQRSFKKFRRFQGIPKGFNRKFSLEPP